MFTKLLLIFLITIILLLLINCLKIYTIENFGGVSGEFPDNVNVAGGTIIKGEYVKQSENSLNMVNTIPGESMYFMSTGGFVNLYDNINSQEEYNIFSFGKNPYVNPKLGNFYVDMWTNVTFPGKLYVDKICFLAGNVITSECITSENLTLMPTSFYSGILENINSLNT